MEEIETCDWCELGVSPQDEELVRGEFLVFHKMCYEQLRKEAARASAMTPEEAEIIWRNNPNVRKLFRTPTDFYEAKL